MCGIAIDHQINICSDDLLNELTDIAIKRIRSYSKDIPYYLAFSGGKDSITIYDLAKKSGVSIESHYHFTTVDPPELTWFIKKNYPEIIWDHPKESMFQLISKKGFFPTRQIRYCCSLLKEYGGHGRTIITGIRNEESVSRSKRKLFDKDERFKDTFYLNPIFDWKEKTVWDYIHHNNLKYCSLYDEGFKRIGCIMCPLQDSAQMEKEAMRWPKFYNAYLHAIRKGLTKAKERGRHSKVSGGTAEETMRWWMYSEKSACAEQCSLFG